MDVVCNVCKPAPGAGFDSIWRMLNTSALTVDGTTLGDRLDAWEQSERRRLLRSRLQEREGVDPNDVILSPDAAKQCGMTSTVCFPHGNLAPEGSVIKSTAIDSSVVGNDGVYRMSTMLDPMWSPVLAMRMSPPVHLARSARVAFSVALLSVCKTPNSPPAWSTGLTTVSR